MASIKKFLSVKKWTTYLITAAAVLLVASAAILSHARVNDRMLSGSFSEVSSMDISYRVKPGISGANPGDLITKTLDTVKYAKECRDIFEIIENSMENRVTSKDEQSSDPVFTITINYKNKTDVILSTESGGFIYRMLDNKKWVGGTNERLLALMTLIAVRSPEIPGKLSPAENTSINVGDKVEKLLAAIIQDSPKDASNPYGHINNNQIFEELVFLGQPALNYMLESFNKSNEDGLREYIMANACARIMGVSDKETGIGISSGREWFYKYGTFYKKPNSYVQIDADIDIFPITTGEKGTVLLPEKVDRKNLDEVVEYYILADNRNAYLTGEKALEAHKIYRTEEKNGIINLYMQVRFGWFGFENSKFTLVSGSGAIPTRMRLKKNSSGEYEVLEYKEAMDGSMWTKSIKEMFPKDLAELVISHDEKTEQELNDIQAAKAEEYLNEINRPGTLQKQHISKYSSDDGVQKAIYLVALMKNEFPDWNGTREALFRVGGPAPGVKVRCIFETSCTKLGSDEYEVLLTKRWDIIIDGKKPESYWKYRVKGEKVELVDSQDNDGLTATIK